jgi:hypothetical protein
MKYKSKGLSIVSMNYCDKPSVAGDYWKKSGFAFPTLMAPDSWHEKYKVVAYPTNYVVGKNGKIVARFVGFDEAGLKKALRSQGVPAE